MKRSIKQSNSVNPRQDTAVQDFSVEWLTDDNVGLISTLLRDTKKGENARAVGLNGLVCLLQFKITRRIECIN